MSSTLRSRKRILIADPEPDAHINWVRALSRTYKTQFVSSTDEVVEEFSRYTPDLLILSVEASGSTSFLDTCRLLKERRPDVQIIIVSPKSCGEERIRCLEFADDYVVKPIDDNELLSRIRVHFRLQSALHTSSSHDENDNAASSLRYELAEARSQAQAVQDITVFALARIAESRDEETGHHLLRMRAYSMILAEYLAISGEYANMIDDDFLDNLYRCSPLHDIGKVAIPDHILLKPGKLTDDEFEIMKRHTTLGARVFEDIAAFSDAGGFLEMAEEIARCHHERFDGNGYPQGLAAHDIPLSARIVSVADTFDAITSARVYKEPYPNSVARQIIIKESGKQFDPVVVDAFVERYDDFLVAQAQFNDELPVVVGATGFLQPTHNLWGMVHNEA